MSRPFIPAPNCASVEMIWFYHSDYLELTFHVQKGSPYSFTDLQAVRGIVDTWDNTVGKANRITVAQLLRIRTKALDTNSSPVEDYYLPAPRAGTQGGPAELPSSACIAVKSQTNKAGRSYRGRMYWPVLGTGMMAGSSNVVAAGTGNSIVANLQTLMANLATGGHTMVVVSYMNNKAWRGVAVPTPIANWVLVDYNLDSQRRRLVGRGHGI